MKTQNILSSIRLMTFIIVLGMFTLNVNANMSYDGLEKSGGGEKSQIEEAKGLKIELEPWMLDLNNFTIKDKSNYSMDWVYVEESENAVQLEDWMTDMDRFMIREQDELNQIEDWMLNDEKFRVNQQDDLNTIESWMIESDIWKI